MKSVEQILLDYDEKASLYRILARKIRADLETSCRSQGIHVHAIDHRVKSRESLAVKLNKPDASYEALADLTDISGIRVITYYASGVDQVAEVVQSRYSVDTENSIDKRALLDPDRFGYLSMHFVVSLSDSRKPRARKSKLVGLKAEIQIRSILQHAWAEIEHDLGYKSKYAVPRKARRTFSRLSGLLELADQEFDSVLQSLRDYAGEIVAAPTTEIAIDRVSLTHFIKTNESIRILEDGIRKRTGLELVFEDWFAESLVEKLNFVGISNLSDLETDLVRLSTTIEAMAIDHIKSSAYTRIHQGVSIFYFCSTLLAESADLRRIVEYLEKFGVGDPKRRLRIAENIVKNFASSVQTESPS